MTEEQQNQRAGAEADRGSTATTDPDESPKERVDRELIELLNGLRVILPGVQVLLAFLLTVPFSSGFEDAVRNAISLGGDADTMACIAGAIAEAYYGGVPPQIAEAVLATLDDHLRNVVREFRERFE